MKKLSVENYSRKVFETEDSIEKVMEDAYFNEFKRRLSVNDVITIRNPKRYEVMVSQLEPFVKVEPYMDFEARISALESIVAGLSNPIKEDYS
jgi:hypothetical protein